MGCKMTAGKKRLETEKNAEDLNNSDYKEENMPRYWTKRRKNLASLIVGIILILLGLGGSTITLINFGTTLIGLSPTPALILGAFFALMGGYRRWQI